MVDSFCYRFALRTVGCPEKAAQFVWCVGLVCYNRIASEDFMGNQELMRIVDGNRSRHTHRARAGVRRHRQRWLPVCAAVQHQDTSSSPSRSIGPTARSRDPRRRDAPALGMGRIGAQTVKQVMIQLMRQNRAAAFMKSKGSRRHDRHRHDARFEGSTMIVSLGRVEDYARKQQSPASSMIPASACRG